MFSRLLSALIFLSVSSFGWSQDSAGGLKIVVLEGEDGVNVIQQNTAVKPIVEVRDRNDLPVASIAVTFVIVAGGNAGGRAGATFVNNLSQITATTDSAGRATVSSINPVGRDAFKIQVRATYQGQTATTTINQTNFQTAADALQAGKTPGSSQSATQSANSSSSTTGTVIVYRS